MEQKKKGNRWIALVVCLLMLSSLFIPFNVQEANAAESELQNPRQAVDGVVTWDCVYFGHYPQSSDGNGGFNKDLIKWRVLSVNGQDAFLIADKNIDGGIPYNETFTGVTWETCTLRSWLNGYGSSINKEGEDYTSDNFVDRAFTSSEQNAIRQTTVVNEDNPGYDTEGGNNTQDKVYLISIGEAKNPEYGFPANYDSSETREAVNTAYTASKSYMNDEDRSDCWWLRSPGGYTYDTSFVNGYGSIYYHGGTVCGINRAVRPALHLNLSSNLWSYAGTVSSDGTVDEEAAPGGGDTPVEPQPKPDLPKPDYKPVEDVEMGTAGDSGSIKLFQNAGGSAGNGPITKIFPGDYNLEFPMIKTQIAKENLKDGTYQYKMTIGLNENIVFKSKKAWNNLKKDINDTKEKLNQIGTLNTLMKKWNAPADRKSVV